MKKKKNQKNYSNYRILKLKSNIQKIGIIIEEIIN